MRKLLLSSSMGLLLAPMVLLADQMTGYISESHCGAAHHEVNEANTKCIHKCLDGGSDPVLVSNGKVLKFDADSKVKAKAFAGQNVTIDGSMEGDTIKINSIDKAQ